MGIVLDDANYVLELIPGGQAARDGADLQVGDRVVAVEGERLRKRALARVLPKGLPQYKLVIRRSASATAAPTATAPNQGQRQQPRFPGSSPSTAAPHPGQPPVSAAAAPGGPPHAPADRSPGEQVVLSSPPSASLPPAAAAAASAVSAASAAAATDATGARRPDAAAGRRVTTRRQPSRQRQTARSDQAPPQAVGGGGEPLPPLPGDGEGEPDAWLMQKVVEVSMLCRSKIRSAADLEGRRAVVEKLSEFLTEIEQVGAALGHEMDVIFQGLIGQMNAGGIDFDSQAGSSDVPMHQAKVLDRSERLGAVEDAIRAHCGGRLAFLVESAVALRGLLRVKVEDGNDLLMAVNTVAELHEFNRRLYAAAACAGVEAYSLYKQLDCF